MTGLLKMWPQLSNISILFVRNTNSWNLLEMEIFRPHPQSSESALGVRPMIYFNKPSLSKSDAAKV